MTASTKPPKKSANKSNPEPTASPATESTATNSMPGDTEGNAVASGGAHPPEPVDPPEIPPEPAESPQSVEANPLVEAIINEPIEPLVAPDPIDQFATLIGADLPNTGDVVEYYRAMEMRGAQMVVLARLAFGRMILREFEEASRVAASPLDVAARKRGIISKWCHRLTRKDRCIESYELAARTVLEGKVTIAVLVEVSIKGWKEAEGTLRIARRPEPEPPPSVDERESRKREKVEDIWTDLAPVRHELTKALHDYPDIADKAIPQVGIVEDSALRAVRDASLRLRFAMARRDALDRLIEETRRELEAMAAAKAASDRENKEAADRADEVLNDDLGDAP